MNELQKALERQQTIVNLARSEGRGLTDEEQTEFDRCQRTIDEHNARTGEEPPAGAEQRGADDSSEATRQAVAAERQRNSDILQLCEQVGMDPQEHIRSGATMEQVREAAVQFMITHGGPIGTRASEDHGDEFRSAAVDALLMRSGVQVNNPAPAANEMRSMSMRDMMIECMARSGEGTTTSLLRMSKDDLWNMAVRQFLTPTAAFPAILDQAIQKSVAHEYQKVPTTFDVWTTRGSLPDFKPSKAHEYLIGGGDFQKVTEGGELKHSSLDSEMKPLRKLDSYGTTFTMTREAFINDDIGFLSEMPAMYARVAKRKINKQVYEILVKNPAVYDGVPLFDTAHKNKMATPGAPTVENVQKMINKMLFQVDPFGESIMVQPRYIICPVGWGFLLSQILESPQIDVDGIGSHTTNALYKYRNQIKVIEEGTINALAAGGTVPWFTVGDPATAKSIQVDYLNGIDTPSFRRSEQAGRLGFVWDIWMDWGITVMDYRGIARNDGAVITAE